MRIGKTFLIGVLSALCFLASLRRGYSVVGYVNVKVVTGLNFLSNPLDGGGTNGMAAVLTNGVVDGTKVYVWNATNQTFLPPSIYSAESSTWSLNYLLPPGRGFVVSSPSNYTATFVGTVIQGMTTNFVAGTNKFSLLGNMIPFSGQLGPNSGLYFPGLDGAEVLTFNPTNQSYSDAYTYFTNYGWFDPAQVADANGPNIALGQSFFVQNPGPDTNWIQTFTAQRPAEDPPARKAAIATSAPDIGRLTINGNQVSLQILNPGGAPYDIQHSVDGSSWQTVASGQTNAVWTGALPAASKGYYQAVSH